MAKRKNIKRLIKVLKNDKTIRFNMNTVATCPGADKKPAGCIAGFAFYTAKGRIWKSQEMTGTTIEDRAARFLGLDTDDSVALFFTSDICYNKTKRKHAIKVLKHLRKTGKVDWSVANVGY